MTFHYFYRFPVLVGPGRQILLLVQFRLEHLHLVSHRWQMLRLVQTSTDSLSQLIQLVLEFPVGSLQFAEILV